MKLERFYGTILEYESNYHERFTSESCFIHVHYDVIKLSDGERLPEVYCTFVQVVYFTIFLLFHFLTQISLAIEEKKF